MSISNTSLISVLDHGYVRLRNVSGPTRRPERRYDADDVDPANSARFSFDGADQEDRTRKDDLRLSAYLVKNRHNTPLEMIEVWLEMKLPIFVARQFVRHRTVSINEVSGRYVTLPAEWYVPDPRLVGTKSASNKQGRDIDPDAEPTPEAVAFCRHLDETCRTSYEAYAIAVEQGVPNELARCLLHLNHYCVHVDTPILTRDLRWVPAGSLGEGDELLAFEEFASGGPGCRRKLVPSTVERFGIKEDELYRIILSNGDEVVCNAEHKWLARYRSGGGSVWKSTAEMIKNPDRWSLPKAFDVWKSGDTYTWGLLAGAFDGEGHLTYTTGNGKSCGFAQKPNALLSAVKSALNENGFEWTNYTHPVTGVVTLHIKGGLSRILEFLGRARPPRLLNKWLDDTDGGLFAREVAHVVSIEPTGRGEIASFQTSTGTYIANGYPCHNTKWLWKQDLHNLWHFLALRLHEHAQYEARAYAQATYDLLKTRLPALFDLFDEHRLG